MRNTKQKRLILDIVNNSYDHLTAEEIYERARSTLPHISLGTVYRILSGLADAKKIKRIMMADGTRFDNLNEVHNHFICEKCHKIMDVKESIKLDYKSGNNKIVDYEINFIGICEDCLKKEEN